MLLQGITAGFRAQEASDIGDNLPSTYRALYRQHCMVRQSVCRSECRDENRRTVIIGRSMPPSVIKSEIRYNSTTWVYNVEVGEFSSMCKSWAGLMEGSTLHHRRKVMGPISGLRIWGSGSPLGNISLRYCTASKSSRSKASCVRRPSGTPTGADSRTWETMRKGYREFPIPTLSLITLLPDI